jgi:uncharacterized membrane protein
MPLDNRERRVLQPAAIVMLGILFLVLGATRYPGFLGVGLLFMYIGLRCLRRSRLSASLAERTASYAKLRR